MHDNPAEYLPVLSGYLCGEPQWGFYPSNLILTYFGSLYDFNSNRVDPVDITSVERRQKKKKEEKGVPWLGPSCVVPLRHGAMVSELELIRGGVSGPVTGGSKE